MAVRRGRNLIHSCGGNARA